MQNFAESRKLLYPKPHSTTEWGVWMRDFLYKAAASMPESQRPAFLRYVFRWLTAWESGQERLSEEEMRIRRERWFFSLPPALQSYFPWEQPEPLPAVGATPPPYPQFHTPFRQYGFLAARWAEEIGTLPAKQQEQIGSLLVRYLYQSLRNQGQAVEEAALVEHLFLLSGERLRLVLQGLEETMRAPAPSAERRHFRRGKGFRRRR